MKNIYLLIGIPGSGKSYWTNNKYTSENCVLDDISQLTNPLELLNNAINNSKIKNIYISDVNFLELDVLKKAINLIQKECNIQKYTMHYLVFKSTKEISEHNVKLRNDGRLVSATILRFHKNYENIINFLKKENYQIIESKKYKKNKSKKLV